MKEAATSQRETDAASLPALIRENVEAVDELKAEAEREAGVHQLVIERAASRLARPITLFILLAMVSLWIGVNVGLDHAGYAPIDAPPFFWLQGCLALYAAMVTTMVLIAQARQRREAERRAHLELHVNLLAEQKATKIIGLLEELRHDLPNVRDREDPIANALGEEIDPKTVHSAIGRLRTKRT